MSFIQKKIPVINFLNAALFFPLYGGFYIVSAKLLQRQTCRFIDFFSGFHYLKPLIIFGFIIDIFFLLDRWLGFLVGLGFLAFLLFFLFTPLLIIDRRLGLWEAMVYSSKTIWRRASDFIVFLILLGLIIWACCTPLGVAHYLANLWFPRIQVIIDFLARAIDVLVLSVVFCAITAAYADLFGLQSQEY